MMPVSDLLMEGVNLMLLGMGIVFIFLAILVVTMSGMSRLAAAIDKKQPQAVPAPQPAVPKAGEDEELVAVIPAAISRFRSR
ncbi:MAG: OadG family protein [Candidatus Sedimenticola endophacoides]